MKNQTLSDKRRRDFLINSLGASAAITLSTPLLATTIDNTSPTLDCSPENIPWSEEMDILVVGTGMAGYVSAIKAAETDPHAKVILIDKMARLGGSSLVSGLNMAVVGSQWQKEAGITDDSWELLLADIEKETRGYNHHELTKILAQNSLRLFEFLTEHGVKYDKNINNGMGIKALGGHSRARVVWPINGGTGIIKSLHKYLIEHLNNLEVRKQIMLEQIYRNDKGRVIGVKVREEFYFNRNTDDFSTNDHAEFNASGETKYYKIRRSLVMASGGFNQDKAFRSNEVGVLKNAVSTANPGATSGALRAMIEAGFKPIHMTLFRFAFAIPTEDIRWGILVNPRTGKRFVDEFNHNDRQALGLAILSERRKIDGEHIILIYDQIGINHYHDKQRLTLSLEGKNGTEGTMWKFDTLEALAESLNINLAGLKTTIQKYNQDMLNDNDEFSKPKQQLKDAISLTTAPYYAMKLNPRYNYSQGGAMITPEARPLDILTNKPIAGAFVCGEASAGVFGYIRLTACSSLDCGIFGMIAGENAAKEVPWY